MENREAILADRRKALEEEFFRKHDQAMVERLREQDEQQQRRAGLAEASGIRDEALLDRLLALGLRPRSLAPLALVPLVEVAWADGKIDARERAAVMRAAQDSGLDPSSPGYALLQSWMEERPQGGLRRLWKEYIAALCRGLDPSGRQVLRAEIVGRARTVAAAAGGFLGLGPKISTTEEEILAELDNAFEV